MIDETQVHTDGAKCSDFTVCFHIQLINYLLIIYFHMTEYHLHNLNLDTCMFFLQIIISKQQTIDYWKVEAISLLTMFWIPFSRLKGLYTKI